MIGLLTEQYAGAFPLWLAPVQVSVLAIADRHVDYAKAVAEALQGYPSLVSAEGEQVGFAGLQGTGLGLRVQVDASRVTLNKKIRDNQRQKVPYMLIVGDKDAEAGTVGVRSREEGDLGVMRLAEFAARVRGEI